MQHTTVGLAANTYTFLFTDIVGSTRLLQSSEDAMVAALDLHDSLLPPLFRAQHGHVFKNMGDAYCVAFASPLDAVHAAIAGQRALQDQTWDLPQPLRVRMAIHTGAAVMQGEDYRGLALSRVARLMSVAHGGQILLSESAEIVLRDQLPENVRLISLGSAQLPSLERPERIFQLQAPGLDHDFPPPRTRETIPHNLKVQLTSFVGRGRELSELQDLCRAHRLVTVTGPGGCGKTRVALQAAANLLAFADGVWMIELAGLTDPALIPAAVAAELKVRQEGNQSVEDALLAYLAPRRLLLILDNCEHLIEASARFAHALLQRAPNVHILATSRERLNVGGETVWRLPPLSPPAGRGAATVASVQGSDAATLFLERAASIQPRFVLSAGNAQPVAQVCRRLEGLPLALELAAAWVGTLPVEQIALRLEEHFRLLSSGPRPIAERHRSLQATLDWSYDLLTEKERILLCRLSVFAGGWTLEAAEAVCAGDGLDELETLDLLSHLVDKSLVVPEEQSGTVRYRLLETLRVYSGDKLRALPNDWCARHASYFLAWAESAEPLLAGSEEGHWLNRIERDHDNLRAALRCLRETDAEQFQRLACALHGFWYARGYLTEGRTWMEEALARAEDKQTIARAKTFNRAGIFAWAQGDLDVAWTRIQASHAISLALGDDLRSAGTLGNLALVAGDKGDFEMATTLQMECLNVRRRLNDRHGMAAALHNLGVLAGRRGDDVMAMQYLREGLILYQEIDDMGESASTSFALGSAAYRLGDIERASLYIRDSLELYLNIGDDMESATYNWLYMSCLAVAKHQDTLAVRFLHRYTTLQDWQKLSVSSADIDLKKKHLEVLHARLTDDEFTALWNDDRPVTIEEALASAELWR